MSNARHWFTISRVPSSSGSIVNKSSGRTL